MMALKGKPLQMKTDNTIAYVSSKTKWIFVHCNIKYIICIPYNAAGQTVIERPNCTLKEMLKKQQSGQTDPRNRLNNTY